ncbi:transposase protein, partial [Pseudomonas cannabina]
MHSAASTCIPSFPAHISCNCTWQHLVFTLPDTLWPLFFHNRHWLDALCRLAVDNLLYAGRR